MWHYAHGVAHANLGNIEEAPLRDLWRGDAYAHMRLETAACRDCFWNCHTELTLALGGGRKAA